MHAFAWLIRLGLIIRLVFSTDSSPSVTGLFLNCTISSTLCFYDSFLYNLKFSRKSACLFTKGTNLVEAIIENEERDVVWNYKENRPLYQWKNHFSRWTCRRLYKPAIALPINAECFYAPISTITTHLKAKRSMRIILRGLQSIPLMAGLQFAIQKHFTCLFKEVTSHAFLSLSISQRFQRIGAWAPVPQISVVRAIFDFQNTFYRCHFMGHRSRRNHFHGNPSSVDTATTSGTHPVFFKGTELQTLELRCASISSQIQAWLRPDNDYHVNCFTARAHHRPYH